MASKTKFGNGFGYLFRSIRKMEIVAHRTILFCDRLVNEPVLKERFMTVFGFNCPRQEKHRQGDEQ